MKKLTLASAGSDILSQIFIEKLNILFIAIKSQFEIAKTFHQSWMVPLYIFESIRIFKLLRQSRRQRTSRVYSSQTLLKKPLFHQCS